MVTKFTFRFEDKSPAYRSRLALALDRAVEHMVVDVDRMATGLVPVLTGRLQSSRYPKRLGPAHWELSYNTPYARRQHFEHRSRSHYLERPGRIVGSRAAQYVANQVRGI